MNNIGQAFAEQNIGIITINIPESLLHEDGKKTRREYITDLFKSIGAEFQFLNATVREDVQKSRPEMVRRTDGYMEKDFRKAIESMTKSWDEAAKILDRIWDWLFAKGSRIGASIPRKALGCSQDEYKKIDHELLKEGVIKCLRSKQGRAACTISHLRALKLGKTKKFNAVLITEDDIRFIQKPERLCRIFNKAMKDLQERDWDIFMLGASGYIPDSRKDKPNAEKVTDNLVKVEFAYGNFAYLVNSTSIDKIIKIVEEHIQIDEKRSSTIYAQDVILAKAMEQDRLQVYSTEPKLMGCVPCHSILCNKEMDYTDVLEREWKLS